MVTITVDSSLSFQIGKDCNQHGVVITEEIEGLIKVYKDGFVERFQIVPCVNTSLAPELGVTSRDIVIDKFTNIWARFYIPTYNNNNNNNNKLPLIVYFHGGGFCVGSAAWSCYHEFLAKLAAKASCLIMSVNYRLAPENPLPAAFDDGIKALMWLKKQALILSSSEYWWAKQCNFSKIFLAGDSAGANIAYNIITRLGSNYGVIRDINPLSIKGLILIQPFFGGEARTNSEKYLVQSSRSALSLENSDTYWRLALPCGANRDHPFCNPMGKESVKKMKELRELEIFVCVSEMDILKDRNLEFVEALSKSGKKVEHVMHEGVGHAFQILSQSLLSKIRTLEMISRIKAFISG